MTVATSRCRTLSSTTRAAVWRHGSPTNGVKAGDRVAFLAGNTTDVFEALFACAKLIRDSGSAQLAAGGPGTPVHRW